MQRKVAVKLGLQVRELDEVARRLAEVGLIDQGTLQPSAGETRQRASDRSVERVRKFRDKQKGNGGVTLHGRFGNAAEAEAEAEAEKKTPLPPKPKSAKPKPAPWTLPAGIDPDLWAEFEGHRKEIAKPLTDRARACNAKILLAMPRADHRRAVEASIANRWTGIFPSKSGAQQNGKPTRADRHEEYVRSLAADLGIDLDAGGSDSPHEIPVSGLRLDVGR
jgi:hypothetical protein